MTVKEIEQTVEEIRSIASDDEAAHSAEDSLWEKVLEAIATGEHNFTPDCPDCSADSLATAALKTRAITFARWCA